MRKRGVRIAAALLLPVLAGGCVSSMDWSKAPVPVSVSAANYSQLSEQELYQRVNAPVSAHPSAPENPVPDKPLFYAFAPGHMYHNDIPLETLYRELAVELAHRGYFNVLYEAQAGYIPKRIDYLLRIHFGERLWRKPTVRTDKVTWGNDGLVSNFRGDHPGQAHVIGELALQDDRSGQDPMEAINVATLMQTQQTFAGQDLNQYTVENISDGGATRDYALILLEAFRFDDVRTRGKDAPCVWATFVAVPLHQGQKLSDVLHVMARTAMPYFGGTTDGIQAYDVPAGSVQVGEPVEVPSSQKPQQP